MDSEFKCVNWWEDEFVELEEELKSIEGCKSVDGFICNSGNVIVDSLLMMFFNLSIVFVEIFFVIFVIILIVKKILNFVWVYICWVIY